MVEELSPEARFVDAFIIDVNGIPRGKRVTREEWIASGGRVAFSASSLVLDAAGISQGPLGIGTRDGDPDALGQPVPGRIVPVPWAGQEIAQSLLSMRDFSGQALPFDPREILAGIVARCREDGLHPVVACELEFYLVDAAGSGLRVPDAVPTGHLCLQEVQAEAPLLHDLHAGLAAQGLTAGTIVSEYGPGQFEVNLTHGPDPVRAADDAVLLRRAVHGVASAHGRRASFMAKPFPDHPGNGLHIHVSLMDDQGRNRFGAEPGLLEAAIAGMQALHAESMAIFAPSFSAYRRYKGGTFVSAKADWGENTRAAAFRIPPGGASSRRVEHRVACADSSPHLVMACILAGLHFGITRGLAPKEGIAGPTDLWTALATLEAGHDLASYLPADFPFLFAALKRAEADAVLHAVSKQEYAYYL